ncbi:hypothetical protein [Methylorubrum aminovorans]|uniref:hypothetical protein n=1 Tax=Methylorubrum aminovorans TaxID=269069 RepID=UPI002E7D8E9E|nr:hypothetical protein VI817_000198 [Penicillium citrinum]
MLARFDARAVRAERAQSKAEQELGAVRAALQQMTIEHDQLSRLAEIFYETCKRMGKVVDHWMTTRVLKGDGEGNGAAKEEEDDPVSMKELLDRVLEELEKSEGSSGVGSENGEAKATPTAEKQR